MAVGSGSRSSLHNRPDEANAAAAAAVGPLGDLGLRGRSTDMTQNLREVEVRNDQWNIYLEIELFNLLFTVEYSKIC